MGICKEMEVVAAVISSRNLYRLLSTTGSRKPSRVIKEYHGSLIHYQGRLLERFWWQFSWPTATVGLVFMPAVEIAMGMPLSSL